VAKQTQHEPTLTELLREALAAAGGMRDVERATGLDRSALRRFCDGRQSLRLDKADVLAAHFGITSKQTKRKR